MLPAADRYVSSGRRRGLAAGKCHFGLRLVQNHPFGAFSDSPCGLPCLGLAPSYLRRCRRSPINAWARPVSSLARVSSTAEAAVHANLWCRVASEGLCRVCEDETRPGLAFWLRRYFAGAACLRTKAHNLTCSLMVGRHGTVGQGCQGHRGWARSRILYSSARFSAEKLGLYQLFFELL